MRDILLATNNGFSRSAVSNRGRTDHGNATKHRNQTEVEGTHDSMEVVCRIVKGSTWRTAGAPTRGWGRYCVAEPKSANLEGIKTR